MGFVTDPTAQPSNWVAFRALPEQIGFFSGLLRLFHNPQWNELLYINTCAEHLFESYSEFSEQEIGNRLLVALRSGEIVATGEADYLMFRIRVLEFDAGQSQGEVVFVSRPFAVSLSGVRQ